MWVMWAVAGMGVLLAAMALKRGPFGLSGAAGIAVPFVCLPLASGVVSWYRLSRAAVVPAGMPHGVVRAAAPAWGNMAGQNQNASWGLPPRKVQLTVRGYAYTAGAAVSAVFVAWLLSLILRGIGGFSGISPTRFALAIFGCSYTLWSCACFVRNRIREKRLFADGEISQGRVLNRSDGYYWSYRPRIVYSYRDTKGTRFQRRATDFSSRLYEDTPVHVFYDPASPRESAAIEGSLYRIG
jgi:hypothetical protein